MDKRDEVKLRAREAFWTAAQVGFFRVLDQAPQVWKGREARFYRAEKKIIMDHMDPFYWGFFVTGFLFVTFRVSGSKAYLRFRDKYIFRTTPLHMETAAPQQQQWTSHLERETKKKESLMKEAVSLPVDLFLSVLCGASSILWLSRPKQVHKDFSAAPLLPGRSLIHQNMCPDLVEAYEKKVDASAFQNPLNEDDVLRTFQTFVTNCKIRSKVISTRRQSGEDRPGVIPYPGIKGKTYD